MKILVIEDDAGIGRLLKALLVSEGYEVEHVETGTEGAARAQSSEYDGIVLDLGLGDRHGLDVLRDLRGAGVMTPVLILTADASETSIVQALDAGADEYTVKPVRNRELAARVRALIRRGVKSGEPEQLVVGPLVLNRLKRKVTGHGGPINLSPREFSLLEYFMRFAGVVVTRPDILKDVWGMDFDPGSNLVDVQVNRLRKKLEIAEVPVRIETQRGTGFCLIEAGVDVRPS
ncbi:MAG: response regulator transcription factor [Gemmatimonadaceae bacterium]